MAQSSVCVMTRQQYQVSMFLYTICVTTFKNSECPQRLMQYFVSWPVNKIECPWFNTLPLSWLVNISKCPWLNAVRLSWPPSATYDRLELRNNKSVESRATVYRLLLIQVRRSEWKMYRVLTFGRSLSWRWYNSPQLLFQFIFSHNLYTLLVYPMCTTLPPSHAVAQWVEVLRHK